MSDAAPRPDRQSEMAGLKAVLRRMKQAADSRPWLRRALDGLLLIAVVLGVGLWQTRAHVKGGALPAVALRSRAGERVELSTLSGKPTLLAFWAPWCTVCETESRNLGWARALLGTRANVVSIASAYDAEEQVNAYVQRNAVDYPVLLDEAGVAEALRVTAYPTVYFLDERGHIKGSVVGYTTTAGLIIRTLF